MAALFPSLLTSLIAGGAAGSVVSTATIADLVGSGQLVGPTGQVGATGPNGLLGITYGTFAGIGGATFASKRPVRTKDWPVFMYVWETRWFWTKVLPFPSHSARHLLEFWLKSLLVSRRCLDLRFRLYLQTGAWRLTQSTRWPPDKPFKLTLRLTCLRVGVLSQLLLVYEITLRQQTQRIHLLEDTLSLEYWCKRNHFCVVFFLNTQGITWRQCRFTWNRYHCPPRPLFHNKKMTMFDKRSLCFFRDTGWVGATKTEERPVFDPNSLFYG